MTLQRHRAAKVLKESQEKPSSLDKNRKLYSEIDDVLDFFSDLGFYVRGNQISPEVAHNHFYHWLRGYWVASRSYVVAYRAKEGKVWENVEELFETLCEIEVGRDEEKRAQQRSLTSKELNEFLNDEIELWGTRKPHPRDKDTRLN